MVVERIAVLATLAVLLEALVVFQVAVAVAAGHLGLIPLLLLPLVRRVAQVNVSYLEYFNESTYY